MERTAYMQWLINTSQPFVALIAIKNGTIEGALQQA